VHESPSGARVSVALTALRAGRPVVVRDAACRADDGDVVLPAALASPQWVAWMVRRTSGFLRVPLPGERADLLDLPPMVPGATGARSGYTVSVDAAAGIGTGTSAVDRAHTARLLAAPGTGPDDLTRPGHVGPRRPAAWPPARAPAAARSGRPTARPRRRSARRWDSTVPSPRTARPTWSPPADPTRRRREARG
jgi:hypothetical protein